MRVFRAGDQDPVRGFELSTPICYRSERILTVQVRAEVRQSAYAVIQNDFHAWGRQRDCGVKHRRIGRISAQAPRDCKNQHNLASSLESWVNRELTRKPSSRSRISEGRLEKS